MADMGWDLNSLFTSLPTGCRQLLLLANISLSFSNVLAFILFPAISVTATRANQRTAVLNSRRFFKSKLHPQRDNRFMMCRQRYMWRKIYAVPHDTLDLLRTSLPGQGTRSQGGWLIVTPPVEADGVFVSGGLSWAIAALPRAVFIIIIVFATGMTYGR